MCPIGQDQTRRGPQQWNLIAPARATKLEFIDGTRNGLRTMHELLSAMSTSRIFDLLVQPILSCSSFKAVTACRPSSLERLPAELVAVILSTSQLSRNDIANLGICSRTTWMHVVQHIRADYRKYLGSWIGTPLICTGTYLTDLPLAILEMYPEVVEAQRVWDAKVDALIGLRRAPYGTCPARIWNWSFFDEETTTLQDVRERWLHAMIGALHLEWGILPPRRLLAELEEALRSHHDVAGHWVLKNLSKRESINLDVMKEADGGTHAKVSKTPEISLDKALLLRVCWTDPSWTDSTSRGHGEDFEEKWLRGDWAGDSFEIVRAEALPCPGWTDVTTVLVEHAAANDLKCEPKVYLNERDDSGCVWE